MHPTRRGRSAIEARRLALEAQPAVGVVLQHQDPEPLAHLHQGRALVRESVAPEGFWKLGIV